jgi:hypothetical protein
MAASPVRPAPHTLRLPASSVFAKPTRSGGSLRELNKRRSSFFRRVFGQEMSYSTRSRRPATRVAHSISVEHHRRFLPFLYLSCPIARLTNGSLGHRIWLRRPRSLSPLSTTMIVFGDDRTQATVVISDWFCARRSNRPKRRLPASKLVVDSTKTPADAGGRRYGDGGASSSILTGQIEPDMDCVSRCSQA